MHTLEIQNILNELYTVKGNRELFKSNRIAFLEAHRGINKKTIEFINELKSDQIEFFANGLLAKRRHAVIDLMPVTYNHLKENFNNLFNNFSENFLPLGIHKHHEDGIAFCDYLLKNELYRNNHKLRDAIRWDRYKMLNFIEPGSFRVLYFKHLPHIDKKGNYIFANLKGKMQRVF